MELQVGQRATAIRPASGGMREMKYEANQECEEYERCEG